MNNSSDFIKNFASKSEAEQKKEAMNILNNMDSKQSAQIKNILSDKEKLNSILSSPEAQRILSKLKGNGNGQHK